MLLIGKVISIFGDKLNDIVIMWLVFQISDSFFLSAISLVVSYLPNVLFSSYIGYLADKYSPKKLVVISDIVNGVLAIILALIIFKSDNISVYIIFIFAFIMALFDCVYSISSQATVKYIVEEKDLLKANATMGTFVRISGMLGTSFGGVLYTIFAPYVLFFINGITFLLSALSEFFINFEFELHIKEKRKFN